MSNTPPAAPDQARELAERGLREQRAGDLSAADRTLTQAMQIDPDAVVELLHETGADTAPDARDALSERKALPPDANQQ